MEGGRRIRNSSGMTETYPRLVSRIDRKPIKLLINSSTPYSMACMNDRIYVGRPIELAHGLTCGPEICGIPKGKGDAHRDILRHQS
jgi:hypothetical protein